MQKKLAPFIFFSLIFFLCFVACKKHKHETPVDQLPPATETGANTFGFLLNGQPWTPKGWNGSTNNLSLYYDDSYHGGTLNITTYRLLSQNDKQTFSIAMNSFQNPGSFYLSKSSILKVGYDNRIQNCTITPFDTSVYRNGKLVITKFDKVNQTISGTFDFVVYDSSCGDTLKITSGRFDLKY
jgi:hypothetical protein